MRLRSSDEMRCAKEITAPENAFTPSSAASSTAAAGACVAAGLPLPEGVSGDIGTVRIALDAALAMPARGDKRAQRHASACTHTHTHARSYAHTQARSCAHARAPQQRRAPQTLLPRAILKYPLSPHAAVQEFFTSQ